MKITKEMEKIFRPGRKFSYAGVNFRVQRIKNGYVEGIRWPRGKSEKHYLGIRVSLSNAWISLKKNSSMENFSKIYKDLCESWIIFDNSTGTPKKIAERGFKKNKIYQDGIMREHFPGVFK